MTEGETSRLIAWSREMIGVHARLRRALAASQEALEAGDPLKTAGRDLLLFCHGFCLSLTGHHAGEDRHLFPAIAAAHPELRGTLDQLEQDHSMIGWLLGALERAVSSRASPEELGRHLEGIGHVMENHFRFEERALLSVLSTLELEASVEEVFGPL